MRVAWHSCLRANHPCAIGTARNWLKERVHEGTGKKENRSQEEGTRQSPTFEVDGCEDGSEKDRSKEHAARRRSCCEKGGSAFRCTGERFTKERLTATGNQEGGRQVRSSQVASEDGRRKEDCCQEGARAEGRRQEDGGEESRRQENANQEDCCEKGSRQERPNQESSGQEEGASSQEVAVVCNKAA